MLPERRHLSLSLPVMDHIPPAISTNDAAGQTMAGVDIRGERDDKNARHPA